MFEVAVQETFAAGHSLRNYKGKCENVHGHNYRVEVTFRGERLDDAGLLVDFADVKRVVRTVVSRLDHQFINDLEPFTKLNPSAENLAKYFFEEVSSGIRNDAVKLGQVKLWETDTTYATYRPRE